MRANISEEFRRPVAEILMKASEGLLQFKTKNLPPGVRDVLVQIRQSAEHQLHITNELIDLAKAEVNDLSLRKRLMSPLPLLRFAFGESRKGRKHLLTEWELDLPESLPWVFIDEERFLQIVYTVLESMNLLEPKGNIKVGAEIQLPYLRIKISILGIELEEDQISNILTPFSTSVRGW